MNIGFGLSPTDVIYYTNLATNGDADAARRLQKYYEFYNFDHELAKRWAKRSAALGNIQSKTELDDPNGFYYRN